MLTVNIPVLVVAGLGLIVIGWIFSPKPPSLESAGARVASAVLRVVRLVGVAALVAALILAILPVFAASDLSVLTLGQLNDTIGGLNGWLEKDWVVLVLICAAALASIWCASAEVAVARAKLAGRVLRATGALRVVVAVLACCSFVGADLTGRLTTRLAEAQSAAGDLRSAQLLLFAKMERAVEADLVAAAIQQASSSNPAASKVRAAYSLAATYLPGRPTNLFTDDLAKAYRPEPGDQVPDLSAAQVQSLSGALDQDPAPKDALVEDMVGVIFDKQVSDRLKDFLVHIDNPILGEFLSAFVDPVFADPAKKLISAQASRALRSKFDPPARRERVASEGQGLERRIADRLRSAPAEAAEGPLGQPAWEAVRSDLRNGIARGLNGKSQDVQTEARQMSGQFDKVWGAMDTLLVRPPARHELAERAFATYLRLHPDYAAIWGYAAIAFTPPAYSDDLKSISVRTMGGKVDALTQVLQMAKEGDARAKTALAELGLAGKVTATSPPDAVAEALYEAHGAYPLDGYLLYFHETGLGTTSMAADYYESKSVADYVGTYCPGGSGGETPAAGARAMSDRFQSRDWWHAPIVNGKGHPPGQET